MKLEIGIQIYRELSRFILLTGKEQSVAIFYC